MFIQITTVLFAMQILENGCKSPKFIDLPSDSDDPDAMTSEATEAVSSTTNSTSSASYPPLKTSAVTVLMQAERRFVPVMREGLQGGTPQRQRFQTSEDYQLKKKISVIIQQTVHDTTKKVASIQKMKEKMRDQAPYKAGYILSLVRKSRLMLNDLFNLAVKHRDNWKALQQLKVFEYIVHTNVDTTNLVRQLVEVHIQHLNSTQSSKKRVVLI